MMTGRGGVTCSSHLVSQIFFPCAPAIFNLNHSSFYHGRTVTESGFLVSKQNVQSRNQFLSSIAERKGGIINTLPPSMQVVSIS